WLKVAQCPLALATTRLGWHDLALLPQEGRAWTCASARARPELRSAAETTHGAGDAQKIHVTPANQGHRAGNANGAGHEWTLLAGQRASRWHSCLVGPAYQRCSPAQREFPPAHRQAPRPASSLAMIISTYH